MRIHSKVLAITAALAIAPMAYAQDNNTANTPKRFSVVGGYAHMVPKSNPGSIAGQTADLDGNGAATLSGTWHANDNWAVELWGTPDKIKTDVNMAGGGRGEFKQQPIAVSGQYHFGQASQPIRPFVGLGYYESNIDAERFDSTNGNHVSLDTPKGPIATLGADFNITDRVFARADARYLKGNADAKVAGVPAGELNLDPWVVGVGVGARF